MLAVDYTLANKLFSYDEITGNILWKKRDLSDPLLSTLFVEKAIKAFNTRCANKKAGTPHSKTNHIVIRHMLGGKDVSTTAHHLAWLIKTGNPPPKGYDIDHIDQNPMNNSWSNLRLVHRTVNICNSDRNRKNNKSGVKGIYWHKKISQWVSTIQISGKCLYLKNTADFFEAVCARKSAELVNDYGMKVCGDKIISSVPQAVPSVKTTKLKGVAKGGKGYRAYYYQNGTQKNLGCFVDWFDAVCAVKSNEHRLLADKGEE